MFLGPSSFYFFQSQPAFTSSELRANLVDERSSQVARIVCPLRRPLLPKLHLEAAAQTQRQMVPVTGAFRSCLLPAQSPLCVIVNELYQCVTPPAQPLLSSLMLRLSSAGPAPHFLCMSAGAGRCPLVFFMIPAAAEG